MVNFPPQFGVMTSPAHGSVPLGIQEGRYWVCDNEVYTRGFEPDRFFDYLETLLSYSRTCLFAVCPDVVGDAEATRKLYGKYAARIKTIIGRVAFVSQDGQCANELPGFDALFIGGTTEWKMSPAADACIREAKRLGKWVHVGRVNSLTRMRHFKVMEVNSVDGTFPCFEPDVAKRRLGRGLAQPPLISLL